MVNTRTIIASKKTGILIRSMKFLYPAVALYFYKSTIRTCMEYCCHVWNGAPSCYLELLDKLQKQICRTLGPSLAASLETLAHCRNCSLSLLQVLLGRCSFELAQLVPLPYSRGSSTPYSGRLHGLHHSFTIPRCCKDIHVNSFFLRTPGLWNSLPRECFSLIFDLSDF